MIFVTQRRKSDKCTLPHEHEVNYVHYNILVL